MSTLPVLIYIGMHLVRIGGDYVANENDRNQRDRRDEEKSEEMSNSELVIYGLKSFVQALIRGLLR